MKKHLLPFAACLAALLLSACSRGTSEDDARKIRDNLGQYYLWGQQHILESGKPEARYADVVGEGKYVPRMEPVSGERYDALVVTADTHSLTVTASDGKRVTFSAE